MAENTHDADAHGRREELPADLRAMDERLTTDAILWQNRLPRTERLDAHARSLPRRLGSASASNRAGASSDAERRAQPFLGGRSRVESPDADRFSPLAQRHTTLAILAAFAMLALVGGLVIRAAGGGFPLVPQSQLAGHPSPAPTVMTTPTHTPTHTPTKMPTPSPTPIPLPLGSVHSVDLGVISPGTQSTLRHGTCPPGYLMAGGGIIVDQSSSYTIMRDDPISTTQWEAEIDNPGGSSITAHLWVECLQISGLAGQVIHVDFGAVNPGTATSTMDASCPSGSLAAGGGIASDSTTLTIMKNAPISPTQWEGEIYNSGSSPSDAQMQVECLKVGGLAGQVLTKSLGPVSPGATVTGQITCPSGSLVAGGGIGTDSTTIAATSGPSDPTHWGGGITNTGSSPITALLHVECVKLI